MVITQAPAETTDIEEALARARAGDAEEFCRLIEPLHNRLLRQAAALSGNVHVAEDLISETLVEAWKCLARYDESCRLSTWLYAILLHRHKKWLRRARSRPVALAWLSLFDRDRFVSGQENLPATGPSPSESAAEQEDFSVLRARLAALPEKYRRVLLLRFFEDASLPDIARVLGCPVGTVKSRLHHALEKMRKINMNHHAFAGDKRI
jgi:RNA polymerase sigma-70 factor (ECF subfamily)